MKTTLILPALLIAIATSSFTPNRSLPPSTKLNVGISAGEQCEMYGVTQVTRNGQMISIDPARYIFYFCSDNMFSVRAGMDVYNGTWIETGKGDIQISISTGDPALDWLPGTWQILEKTDNTLVLERSSNGDTWKAEFERRQR